jgi:hypothetical protein
VNLLSFPASPSLDYFSGSLIYNFGGEIPSRKERRPKEMQSDSNERKTAVKQMTRSLLTINISLGLTYTVVSRHSMHHQKPGKREHLAKQKETTRNGGTK